MTRITRPRKKKRARVHGFLKRMRKNTGQKVLRNRRHKGRHRLAL